MKINTYCPHCGREDAEGKWFDPCPSDDCPSHENKPPQTNVERVTEYMEYGNPLKQAFVIEALNRYAKQIVDNQAEVIASMKNSFVNPASWIDCAQLWQATEKPVDTGAKS